MLKLSSSYFRHSNYKVVGSDLNEIETEIFYVNIKKFEIKYKRKESCVFKVTKI